MGECGISISKTVATACDPRRRRCLIDGASGVDLGTVLLDFAPDAPRTTPEPWCPEPEPSDAELTRDALLELRERPRQLRDAARRVWEDPEAREHLAGKAREVIDGIKSFGRAASELMPHTSLNSPLGARRRYQVVRLSLADVKRVRKRHACTVNDVVLALVTSALRKLLLTRGESVEGLTMKAMVPVSVRDASQARTWGNKVDMIAAELPVGEPDPEARLVRLRDRMTNLKRSRQAVGADFWVQLGEYAPPTLLSLVGRAVALQRMVNLVVTNVPGPRSPCSCAVRACSRRSPTCRCLPRTRWVSPCCRTTGRWALGSPGTGTRFRIWTCSRRRSANR